MVANLQYSEQAVQNGYTVPTKFHIKRLGVFLGAEITDVDLTQPLNATAVKELLQAHAEYGVLVFRHQTISTSDLKRFGHYFGNLSVHPFSTNSENDPEVIEFDNKGGNPPYATNIWHTDETFRSAPPVATALCAKIVPEYGGNTSFASMSAIYEGLSDRWQHFLSGLEAVHDFKPFRAVFKNDASGRKRLHEYEEKFPPVTHPVVTRHPITGKKILYVNPQFTLHIKGMDPSESQMILDFLYKKTLIHEYQYRNVWEPDMLVCWDNRSTQHCALHDYYPQRRKMERVTVTGTVPIPAGPKADERELRTYLMPPFSAFRDAGTTKHRQSD